MMELKNEIWDQQEKLKTKKNKLENSSEWIRNAKKIGPFGFLIILNDSILRKRLFIARKAEVIGNIIYIPKSTLNSLILELFQK